MIHRRGRVKALRHSLRSTVAAVALAGAMHAQSAGTPAPTNLRIYQTLAASLGDSLATSIPPADTPRVNVHISPADVAWFLQDDVERAFRGRHCEVHAGDSARYNAEMGATGMHVRYTNLRRSGLFGPHLVDRTVTLEARTRLTDRRADLVLASGEHTASFTDTVAVSDVGQLEQASIPYSRQVAQPLVYKNKRLDGEYRW